MTAVRIALATTAAMLLSACNMVISHEPMLARGPDTPVMKPGIWADISKEDCEYDVAAAPDTWPECADPAIIGEDGGFYTFDKKSESWKSVEAVLSNSDPVVVQVELPLELTGGNPMAPKYIYLAMRPTETDEAGQITAIDTWMMYCGPVEKNEEEPAESFEDAVTKEPFEGLTVAQGNCIAEDVAALVNAAVKSEALDDEEVGGARWLRAADDVELE